MPPSVGNQLAQWLSPDELARLGRYRFERDRLRFMNWTGDTGESCLGAYLELDPKQLIFDYGPHGKPHVNQESTQSPIQFNLSHSEDLSLFAFTKNARIGVDLEHLRPIPELIKFVKGFLPPAKK